MHTRVRQAARVLEGQIVKSMSIYATQKVAMAKWDGVARQVYRKKGGGIQFLRFRGKRGKILGFRDKGRMQAGANKPRVFVQAVRKKNADRHDMYFPAKPGEVPHVRTAKLKKSIFWQYDRPTYTARVGTPVLYGKYLEQGTRKMAARPFIMPALFAMQSQITAILTAPVSGM